jgi:hypothetical protein
MPANFKTYEAQARLLCAVVAAHPELKLDYKSMCLSRSVSLAPQYDMITPDDSAPNESAPDDSTLKHSARRDSASYVCTIRDYTVHLAHSTYARLTRGVKQWSNTKERA